MATRSVYQLARPTYPTLFLSMVLASLPWSTISRSTEIGDRFSSWCYGIPTCTDLVNGVMARLAW